MDTIYTHLYTYMVYTYGLGGERNGEGQRTGRLDKGIEASVRRWKCQGVRVPGWNVSFYIRILLSFEKKKKHLSTYSELLE